MARNFLVGKSYVLPDLVAKVTREGQVRRRLSRRRHAVRETLAESDAAQLAGSRVRVNQLGTGDTTEAFSDSSA